MREAFLTLLLNVTSRLLLRRDRMNGIMEQILSAFAFANERLKIVRCLRLSGRGYAGGFDLPRNRRAGRILGEGARLVEGDGRLLAGVQLFRLWHEHGSPKHGTLRRGCGRSLQGACSAGPPIDCSARIFSWNRGRWGSSLACRHDGLVLCEGFSSLREAAIAMGFPRWITRVVPDAWDTVHRVSALEIPVLVVHSDVDGLFPLSMAQRVAEACGSRGTLVVIEGVSHNAPIFAPTEDYWRPIAEWVKERSSEVSARTLPARGDQSALRG